MFVHERSWVVEAQTASNRGPVVFGVARALPLVPRLQQRQRRRFRTDSGVEPTHRVAEKQLALVGMLPLVQLLARIRSAHAEKKVFIRGPDFGLSTFAAARADDVAVHRGLEQPSFFCVPKA